MAEFSQLPTTLNLRFISSDDVIVPLTFTGVTLTTHTIQATLYRIDSTIIVQGARGEDRTQYNYSTYTWSITTAAVSLSEGKITMRFPPLSDTNTIAQSWYPYRGNYRFAVQWRTSGTSFFATNANTLTVVSGKVTSVGP